MFNKSYTVLGNKKKLSTITFCFFDVPISVWQGLWHAWLAWGGGGAEAFRVQLFPVVLQLFVSCFMVFYRRIYLTDIALPHLGVTRAILTARLLRIFTKKSNDEEKTKGTTSLHT